MESTDRALRRWALPGILTVASIIAANCGGGGGSAAVPPGPTPSSTPVSMLPLVVGNTWVYACYLNSPTPGASTFPKTNQVTGTAVVNGVTTYVYQEQIPSSPTQSTTVIQLLAEDAAHDTVLYGYEASPGSSPFPVASPTVIVAPNPGPSGTIYDYPLQGGGIEPRVFCCNTPTHPTVLGTFQVDAYFDGSHTVRSATDGYGYAPGLGVMEEDHNFNDPNPANRIDCLIVSTPPP